MSSATDSALSPKPGYATLSPEAERGVGRLQIAAYSLGHVLNDMAAAVWFSYLLLYLQEAEGLSGTQAGAVMFAGQLADALATPLVGIASDASAGCLGLGRRKAWNAAGVAIVALNFGLMFGSVLPGSLGAGGKAAALGLFAALFNVGWAAVQVSHMALVPELTRSEGMRVVLNSARYALTVLSNCAVFLTVLGLVGLQAGPTTESSPRYRDPALYTSLSHAVLGAGLGASALFLLFCREPTRKQLAAAAAAGEAREAAAAAAEGEAEAEEGGSRAEQLLGSADAGAGGAGLQDKPRRGSGERGAHYAVGTWRDWLRVPDFWRIMGVYTLVRLSVNISQVYLTFFVTEALRMEQTAVALTPLLLYVAQLGSTLASRRVAVRLGRRRAIGLGSLLTVAACVAMGSIQQGSSTWLIYPSVVLLGVGLALNMVISVSMEADLVGNRTASAAFVYGACSFADKLSSGVFVLGIQTLRDLAFPEGSTHHAVFIRLVNAAVPAGAAVLAAAIATTISFPSAPRGGGVGAVGGVNSAASELRAPAARRQSRGLISAALLGDGEEEEEGEEASRAAPMLRG